MADETILEIGRTVTIPDADASAELQSASLGSAQMPWSAINYPLDSGLFTISSASLTTFAVPFNYTLRSAPTRIRLTLMMPAGATGATSMPGLAALPNNETNFTLFLSGPTGDTTHQVFWEALP